MSSKAKRFFSVENIAHLLNYNLSVLKFSGYEAFIHGKISVDQLKPKITSSGFQSRLNRYFAYFYVKNGFVDS